MAHKVALLVGGWSAERQVSLDKGRAVEAGLKEAGYEVEVIDVARDPAALITALAPAPDCIFNNLHGQGGEDGVIQGLLEMLDIPYTHSGVLASSIAMDKPMARRMAQSIGVAVPEGAVCGIETVLDSPPLDPPYVVKPVAEGSSVGVRIIQDNENQPALDFDSWAFGEQVLVERFIPGRELTVAVLDGKAQAVTEIVSETRFFDYEAKYHDTRTRYDLPADIPKPVYDRALQWAADVFGLLGCRGLARCDFRYDDRQGEDGLYFLEINTQPGFTAQSIGPSQVIYNGMSFAGLVSHLVESAVCHHKIKIQDQKAHAEKSLPENTGTTVHRG